MKELLILVPESWLGKPDLVDFLMKVYKRRHGEVLIITENYEFEDEKKDNSLAMVEDIILDMENEGLTDKKCEKIRAKLLKNPNIIFLILVLFSTKNDSSYPIKFWEFSLRKKELVIRERLLK